MRTLTVMLLALWTLGGVAAQPAGGAPTVPPPTLAQATFAGGCFWCMEPPYEKEAGVAARKKIPAMPPFPTARPATLRRCR